MNEDCFDFQLDTEFLQCEDFLVGDVRVRGERHLILATPFQLRLLNETKRWFMDGTFKVTLSYLYTLN